MGSLERFPISRLDNFTGRHCLILEAKVHYGNQLRQCVGFSIYFKPVTLIATLRTSGMLLCIGIGSYLAYRLCLKLLKCEDLAELLEKLSGDASKNIGRTPTIENVNEEACSKTGKRTTLRKKLSSDGACSLCTVKRLLDEENPSVHFRYNKRRVSEKSGQKRNFTDAISQQACGKRAKSELTRSEPAFETKFSNHVTPYKHTNALSDDEVAYLSDGTESATSDSCSPPPIGRKICMKSTGSVCYATPSSVSSCRSSALQTLAWDAAFSPSSLDQELMKQFEKTYSNVCNNNSILKHNDLAESSYNNQSNFYCTMDRDDPDILIRRLLDSLRHNETMDDCRLPVSPMPCSESSELSGSLAFNDKLGDETLRHLQRAESNLSSVRRQVVELDDHFAASFDDKRLQWLASADYARVVYTSTADEGGSSPDDEEWAQSKEVPCKRQSCIPWEFDGRIKKPVDRMKRSQSVPETQPSALKNFDDLKCMDSLALDRAFVRKSRSLSSLDPCRSYAYHCASENDHYRSIGHNYENFGKKCCPKISVTCSSFFDSCISTSYSSSVANSCSDCMQISGNAPFAPSLGTTPEDDDAARDPTEDRQIVTQLTRPDSLIFVNPDTERTSDFCTKDCNANHCLDDMFCVHLADQHASGLINIFDYVTGRFPDSSHFDEDLRRLAKRRGLYFVKLMSDPKDSLLESFLFLAQSKKIPIFKCSSFLVVKEALTISVKRHPFIGQFFAVEIDADEELASDLQVLWNFHNNIASLSSFFETSNLCTTPSAETVKPMIRAIKVLMVLRLLETFEKISLENIKPTSLYGQLLDFYAPYEILSNFCEKSSTIPEIEQLKINLLADTIGITVEIFDFSAQKLHISTTYPSCGMDNTTVATICKFVDPWDMHFMPFL